jgi:hypothetical protein
VRALIFITVCLSCAGCYAAHERGVPAGDAGGRSDAPAHDAFTPPDAFTEDDASTSCGPLTAVIDVPAGGCTQQTIATTAGNACGRDENAASQMVRIRRPEGGQRWYFLIRSRDPAATRLAAGLIDDASCTCRFQASVTGGDLTMHGVGGDLANVEREADLVLDGDERAIWLRVCDGPPS